MANKVTKKKSKAPVKVNGTAQRWTVKDVNRVVALMEKDLTVKEIAAKLGRSYSSVQTKIVREGLR